MPMRIRRSHIRAVVGVLATFVVAVVVTAPVGQFFISLADERGWYQHPSASASAMMALMKSLASAPWFHWFGGGIIGFVLGAWFDSLAKRPLRQQELSQQKITMKTSNRIGTRNRPNYIAWDLHDNFTLTEAAALWGDLEPGAVTHYQCDPFLSFLKKAIINGELLADLPLATKIAIGGHPTLGHTDLFEAIADHTSVARKDLESLAKLKDRKPYFLFPDERRHAWMAG